MSKGTKKFVKGSLILSVAALVAKLLSACFRIPLTNMIGDVGMAYFNYGYPIYTLFTAIAIVGIPSTVAKLVAEKRVNGQYGEAHIIFKHTMKVMLMIGVIMAALLGLGAPVLISLFKWESQTIYSLWGLALSPLFVCVMGVYRGYFQGMQNMVPTAISQVVENFGRVLVGLTLAYLFLPNIGMAAGGASFGAVAGGMLGVIILIIIYIRYKPAIEKEIKGQKNVKHDAASLTFKAVAKTVLWIAIPISIGAAVNSVINFMDSAIVTARLISIGVPELEATAYMGQLGKVATLINFPLTFGMALVIGLVPAISEAMAKNDQEEVQGKIELGSRFALLISLPASVGLAVLAEPIMLLLYPTAPEGASILAMAAFSIAFIMLGQAFTGILQGMGNVWVPVKALGLAAAVKAILNFILVGTSLRVEGAALASIVAYAIFTLYNYREIKKKTSFRLNVSLVIIKPIIASIVMGLSAWGTYKLLQNILSGDSFIQVAIMALGGVGVGIIIYVIAIFLLGGITKEDINEIRTKKEN